MVSKKDMANKLYFDSISSKNKWSDSDIRNMYNFVLEGCRESGIANPGFKIDYRLDYWLQIRNITYLTPQPNDLYKSNILFDSVFQSHNVLGIVNQSSLI
jgi:hypothetical protein